MQFESFWKIHCFWVLLIVLGISGQTVRCDSPKKLPASRDGLNITSSKAKIFPNMTDHLSVSCEFTKPANSTAKFVVSLALSSWDIVKLRFRKLLSITSFNPTATVEHDVRASTSGALDQNGRSFLTLEWNYPSEFVATRYLCTVYTLGASTNPLTWNVSLEIQVEFNGVKSLAGEVLALKKKLQQNTGEMSKLEKKVQQNTGEMSNLEKEVENQDGTMQHLHNVVADLHDLVKHDLNFKIDNTAMYWIKNKLDFKKARAACIVTGGKLAEFKFDQLKAMKSQIKAAVGVNDIWVGYYRDDTSTNWKYASTGNIIGTLPVGERLTASKKCLTYYVGYADGYDADPCSWTHYALCVRS